jgi:hypothetical protein
VGSRAFTAAAVLLAVNAAMALTGLLVRIQQWTDAEGTIRLEGDEPCGERTCDRLRLVPAADNGEFPCASYRLWFTRDDRLLERAELYDSHEALMKTIACRGYFATGRFMTEDAH